MTFRELLRKQNLTQNELARRVGISQQSVSAWCNGAMPKTRHIGLVADVLNVSVGDLLCCFEEKK